MKYILKLPAVITFILILISIVIVLLFSLIWHFNGKRSAEDVDWYISAIENTMINKWLEKQLKFLFD